MLALRGIARSARLWRWWSLAALLELGFALPPALLWQQWLGGAAANRYEPGELFANLSLEFRTDHAAGLRALNADASLWLGFAALALMLLGAFFAGGWAELALDEQAGKVLARAGHGARRFFWRFVRVWLVTLVLLALWSWVMFDKPWKKLVLDWILRLPDASGDRLEALTSEWSAIAVQLAQAGIYALGFALLLATADYARLLVASRDGKSALAGWFGAARLVLGAPLRTLRPLAALLLVETALVAFASWCAHRHEAELAVNEAGLRTVGLLASITVLLAFLRCWLRGAKYVAAAEIVREQVRRP